MDLEGALCEANYNVVAIASSGSEALEAVKECHPNLVLMDIHLDGEMDGIMSATLIRKEFNVPIIYLTAHSDDATLERAQESLPYGYIVKPFNERELYSMIKMALFKHEQEQKEYLAHQQLKNENQVMSAQLEEHHLLESTLVSLGEHYVYNREEKTLLFDNAPLKLTKKECAFLEIMVQNVGHTVSFENLEQSIWDDGVPGEGTLRSLVRRVRDKLEEPLIENITGFGYKLNA
jgi:DNA-binding response OmpR family regulator